MKNKKQIILYSMTTLLIVLTVYIEHFADRNTEKQGKDDREALYINEVCSSYFPIAFSETHPASDWIELYNASDMPIDLGNYYLSDDKEHPQKYRLPSVSLAPGGYYVIHSEYEIESDEQVIGEALNFRISSQGETVYLSGKKGVIDVVDVPAMDTNTTWSRLPDAGAEWGNTESTYCSSNDGAQQIPDQIEMPTFSAAGGFYPVEFTLTLQAPTGCNIFYTLDGSDPDMDSALYETPIPIRDTSSEHNVYSSREDFNPLHEGCVDTPTEKITVVRAMAVDADGRKSDIATNSYLVGKEDKANYSEMYTVSLVTDPDNLFDYHEGIYVLGENFDDYVAEGGSLDDPISVPANYRIHGKRSERPASIEIFNEEGELVLDKHVGIRIHGGTTRGCAQKSFSVYARDMYDNTDTITGLFGEDSTVRKFFIYTNREGTKLRDTLIARTLSDRNMATQSLIHCNVFLDGEYWGVYLLAEEYDEYFFENHYGIRKDNIEICENTPPSDIVKYLSSVPDTSADEVYDKLCEMIDVQSFIDYFAAMLYLNNDDWLGYNVRCYRSITPGPGENEDGRWRWGVWDVESTMYEASVNTFCNGNVASWEDDQLAQALMEHEAFRQQFVNTYMDLYNNIWQEDHILSVVAQMENDIAASYAMHSERFYAGIDTSEYNNKLKTFFTERSDYAFTHVKEEFQLNADPAWIIILANKDDAASYSVNTSVIDMPGSWWQGLYFPDYPIEIRVDEIYGDNTFLGWYSENDELLSTDRTITVTLQEGTNFIHTKFAEP